MTNENNDTSTAAAAAGSVPPSAAASSGEGGGTGIVPPPPKRNESDVYDRQIRLWGAEAQAKMSSAKVLYIHVTGVSSEIVKNLVLAGIRAVLCDPRPVSVLNHTPCLFVPAETTSSQDANNNNGGCEEDGNHNNQKKMKYATVAEAVAPAVEDLNPLLGTCEIVHQSVSELWQTEDDHNALSQFPIVIASHITMDDAIGLSKKVVEENHGKFYMVDTFGMYGVSVFDLGANHTYRPEKGKDLLDVETLKEHVPLQTILQHVPLSDSKNRFHKKFPPKAWVLYKCLLEYMKQKGCTSWSKNVGNTSTTKEEDEFVSVVREWIQQDSPSLLENDPEHVLTESSLRELYKMMNYEVAPVCAVLGGVVGNEVIKAISGKGEPANNTLLFDGLSCKAWTFLVQPK